MLLNGGEGDGDVTSYVGYLSITGPTAWR